MGKKRHKKKRKLPTSSPVGPTGDPSLDGLSPERPPARRDRERKPNREAARQTSTERRFALAIVTLALVAFAQTVTYDFTYDDVPIVRDNLLIRDLGNVPTIFKTNYWGAGDRYGEKGHYRPFTMLTYALQYAVHGSNPHGFHLVNVVLHGIVCLLLFLLAARLFASVEIAAAGALLFAVHPIHVEAVAGIVGRADMLSFMGLLLCVFGYVRTMESVEDRAPLAVICGWAGLSAVAYFLGMLSKEPAVLAPAVIVLTEILLPNRRKLLRLNGWALSLFVIYCLVFGLFMLLRARATLSEVGAVEFEGLAAHQRMLTGLRVVGEYVGLLLFPRVLSAAYARGDMHIAEHLTEPGVLIALAVVLLLLFAGCWYGRRRPVIAWGLLFFLGCLFPVSNIPFPIGVMKGERLLYMPSAGFLLAVAGMVAALCEVRRHRELFRGIMYAMVALLLVRTVVRNPDWRNNLALANATLKVSPSAHAFRTLQVNWYREQGRDDVARSLLTAGGTGAPTTVSGLYNLGNVELDAAHYQAAVDLYRRVLEVDPGHTSAMNNLGLALKSLGRPEEAIRAFEELRRVSPNNPGAYVNLMDLYLRQDRLEPLVPLVEDAVARFPRIDAIHWNAGAVYQKLGRTEEAQAAFARAAQLNPEIRSQRELRRDF